MENAPHPLTAKDWTELLRLPAIRESWGLEDEADEAGFRAGAFAVKFNYISDGPGYAGDLFVILGGEPEIPPVVIVRRRGKLQVVATDNK